MSWKTCKRCFLPSGMANADKHILQDWEVPHQPRRLVAFPQGEKITTQTLQRCKDRETASALQSQGINCINCQGRTGVSALLTTTHHAHLCNGLQGEASIGVK